MNGIEASPTQVAPHFRGIPFTLASFKSFPVPHVIRLIIAPGIATEANICQRNTSPAIPAAGFAPPPNKAGFCDFFYKISIHIGFKGFQHILWTLHMFYRHIQLERRKSQRHNWDERKSLVSTDEMIHRLRSSSLVGRYRKAFMNGERLCNDVLAYRSIAVLCRGKYPLRLVWATRLRLFWTVQ